MRTDIFHNASQSPVDGLSYPSVFNELNSCSGSASEITPEFALKLGRACASVSKRIAISSTGHSICKLLLYAFLSGAGTSGAQLAETDADFYAVASYIASVFDFDLTIFIENDTNKLRIRFLDNSGLSPNLSTQKKIDLNFNKPSVSPSAITDILLPSRISGTNELFSSQLGRECFSKNLHIAVRGKTPSSDTLRSSLTTSGCEIVPERKGILLFDISSDGLKLRIRDEKEFWHDEAHIAALIAFLYFSSGNSVLVTDSTAPSVIEQIASDSGGKVLRLGKDRNSTEIFKRQFIFKNAIANAVYLCSYLSSTGQSLFELMKKIPDFTMVSREIHIKSDKNNILAGLIANKENLYSETPDSLRICTDGGWINIAPSRTGRALQVTAESFNEEIASELCDLYIEKTSHLDSL